MAVKFGVFVLFLVVLCSVRLAYRQYYGQQDCEMTYMWRWPAYQEVPLPQEVESKYPQYGLYLYYEGSQARQSLPLPLRGVPALFLPGNAGSHKQARSSASIALRMHASDFAEKKHFDFFTIDFNEELSGMFGGILQTQTDYVVKAIRRILALYEGVEPCPKSVVIVGHSMGGVIARGLFTHPDFDHSTVTTIVALSSPLLKPVVTFDPLMQDYYDKIHSVWSVPTEAMSHVTLVSVSGGERDVMVPTHLTFVPSAINIATPAVPRNWASADHLAVVWCRRVQLAVTRAMFMLQGGGRELTGNYSERVRVMSHLLFRGKEIPEALTAIHKVTTKDILFSQTSEYTQEGVQKGPKRVAIPLPSENRTSSQILVSSNTVQRSWVHVCSLSTDTLLCTDLSHLCSLLPPKDAVVKVATLSAHTLDQLLPGATHLLVASPTHAKTFVKVQQCDSSPDHLPLPWLRSSMKFPKGHCSLTILSLPDLNKVWLAYRLEVWSQCGGVAGGPVTPWYPHPPLSNTSHPPLTLTLSLLAPPPSHDNTPPPHLLLWSSSECDLDMTVTFDPLILVDKLAIIHAPLLLPWVTGLCVSASSRWLRLELLLLVLLQAIVTMTTRTDGIFESWDWVELYPLWSGCGPVLLHLLAYGLQQLMSAVVSLLTAAWRVSFGRCCGRGCSVVLLGLSVASLWFCSSISLLCATLALVPAAAKDQRLKQVICVLICWLILTLPSLFSWARGIGFTLQLFPDPHWGTVLASLPLLASLLGLSYRQEGDGKRNSVPILMSTVEGALGLSVICGCLLHAYQMVFPVLAFLCLQLYARLASL